VSAGLDFTYAALPARVVFGAGRIDRLAAELDRLTAKRTLFVCTKGGRLRYASIIDDLGAHGAGVFAEAEPHCPQPVAEAALAMFSRLDADSVVSVGGGSTIGLGKYIAAKTGRPLLAVPTTMSGSEMTPLYGIKVGLEKRTAVDPAAKARTVIYDPLLTASLPLHETATTGMNGLAHCVEALYPAEPNPIAHMLALEGIAAFARGLPGVIERNDVAARTDALYGGFIGGLLVSMVGIGLHHKICHILGGRFGVPHGESNSVMLPYVVAFNAPAIRDNAAAIARAMHHTDATAAMFDLVQRIGAPRNLRDLGLKLEALDDVVREVVAKPISNPRPVTSDAIRELLDAAWHGRAPPIGGTAD
jgi:alcohol dehydrogenase class IV